MYSASPKSDRTKSLPMSTGISSSSNKKLILSFHTPNGITPLVSNFLKFFINLKYSCLVLLTGACGVLSPCTASDRPSPKIFDPTVPHSSEVTSRPRIFSKKIFLSCSLKSSAFSNTLFRAVSTSPPFNTSAITLLLT